jgi:hypothetical protein
MNADTHLAERRPGRKTARTSTPRAPVLAEPVIITEWKKNRAGETIRVRLSEYEGHLLIDIRTWWSSGGIRKPGKGFAASIRHLPELAKAVTAALEKARALKLIDDEAGS